MCLAQGPQRNDAGEGAFLRVNKKSYMLPSFQDSCNYIVSVTEQAGQNIV